MKAVIFYHHTMFGKRYTQVVICQPNEVDEVIENYHFGELERWEVCNYVLDTNFKEQ